MKVESPSLYSLPPVEGEFEIPLPRREKLEPVLSPILNSSKDCRRMRVKLGREKVGAQRAVPLPNSISIDASCLF